MSTPNTVLKKCPFCGSTAELSRKNTQTESDNFYYQLKIICSGCKIEILGSNIFPEIEDDGGESLGQKSQEELSEKWNKRTPAV